MHIPRHSMDANGALFTGKIRDELSSGFGYFCLVTWVLLISCDLGEEGSMWS